MAPEWSRAAQSLHPLIPLYAVDCNEEHNKPLCAKEVCTPRQSFSEFIYSTPLTSSQGVKGFPTVKVQSSTTLMYTLACKEG